MNESDMKAIGVIPARMGSTRFFGKPLAPILGSPMIEHVFRRVSESERLSRVLVATCDEEIREVVEGFGGEAVMTSPDHERATDRVAEAVMEMDADVVVMVQGDEPLTHPEMIDLALDPFLHNPEELCVNLAAPIRTEEEFLDRNTIKVVTDSSGYAMYFSREPIPHLRGSFSSISPLKQVCVIPFRRDFLVRYGALPPTPNEEAESVDMMRILEHGLRVRIVVTDHETHAVDVPEDIPVVETLMRADEAKAR